jgi:hypothetical protein
MSTPDPDEAAISQLRDELLSDAVGVRDMMDRAARRWQWVRTLGRDRAGPVVYDNYERLNGLATVYRDQYDGELIEARRGR